jgi:hypothetical protein
MRVTQRLQAPILLLILALPVISIALAAGLGLRSHTLMRWYYLWFFVCGVPALVFAFLALSQTPKAGSPIDEAGQERYRTTIGLMSACFIAGLAVLVAVALSPIAALAIVAPAIAWIALWSIPQFRRTRITSAFVIHCSQKAAFTFVSDARNNPLWRLEYQSVELLTPEPIGPGSRFQVRTRTSSKGRVYEAVEEIIGYEPNRRFTSWVSSGLHPNLDECTFDVVDGGTRVTQRFDFEYSFSMAAGGALFAQPRKNRLIMVGRRAGEIRLKQILEAGGSETEGS